MFYGCSKTAHNPQSGIAIKDDIGSEIRLDAPPGRIISLAPNITEALYAIGADSLLVGVTDFCDYPPQAKTKRSVGNYLSPDFESILSIKPDLVIMYVTNSSVPAYKTLSDNGIKIYASNPIDIGGIKKMIKDFGLMTGKQRNADSVNAVIDSEISSWQSVGRMESAFIVISVNPLMTANGTTFISQILAQSGYQNIFSELQVEYPLVSAEELVGKQPSALIFPADTSDTKIREEHVSELRKAAGPWVDKAKIIFIDDDIMFRPGPRIADALRILRSKHAAD
jgi:iron complex transport system substrate-binding protein